jgi:hypothetical protein
VPAGKLLRIYLNDHYAAATAGLELARRCLRENRGTDLGAFLAGFTRELEEDRASLGRVMESHGIAKSPVKQAAAVVLERVGRLKLNGQLSGYSDLSRLLELEGLTAGIEAKASLWRNLHESDLGAPSDIDLGRLCERAEWQRRALEPHRLAASRRALRQ